MEKPDCGVDTYRHDTQISMSDSWKPPKVAFSPRYKIFFPVIFTIKKNCEGLFVINYY